MWRRQGFTTTFTEPLTDFPLFTFFCLPRKNRQRERADMMLLSLIRARLRSLMRNFVSYTSVISPYGHRA
jgi:hypothetical protein